MPDQKPAPVDSEEGLQALVAQMLEAGASQDDVARVTQAYDDHKHPWQAAIGGGVDGIISGLTGLVTAPVSVIRALAIDSAHILTGNTNASSESMKYGNDVLEGLKALPAAWDEGGPRERAKMITETLTSAVGGLQAGRHLGKPAVRVLGEGMQYYGEHPFAQRLASGTAVVHGIWNANPTEVVAGVGAAALPPALKAMGRRMRIWAGEDPAVVKLGREGVEKLNDKFSNAMSDRNVSFYDEQQAATAAAKKVDENAANLAKIKATKAGRAPSEPSVRETVSATTPEGGRTSMSTSFKAAEDVAESAIGRFSKEEVAGLRKQGYTDESIAKLAQADAGAASPVRGTRIANAASKELQPPNTAETFNRAVNGGRYAPASEPVRLPLRDVLEKVTPSQSKNLSKFEGLSVNDLPELTEIVNANPSWGVDEVVAELRRLSASRGGVYRDASRIKEPQ